MNYFGITGITNSQESKKILDLAKNYGFFEINTHKLMIGILISYKIFIQNSKFSQRYISNLNSIFQIFNEFKDYPIFKTIHYNSHNLSFSKELIDILSFKSENGYNKIPIIEMIDGIQLNIPNPNSNEIKLLKANFPSLKIIYQLRDLLHLESQYETYKDCIDFLLVDNSLGKGIELTLDSTMHSTYSKLFKIFKGINIGFAGGLDYSNIENKFRSLKSLKGDINFSLDAESSLRNNEDKLSLNNIELYLKYFINAIKNY